jgi:hypothetical protein
MRAQVAPRPQVTNQHLRDFLDFFDFFDFLDFLDLRLLPPPTRTISGKPSIIVLSSWGYIFTLRFLNSIVRHFNEMRAVMLSAGVNF